MRMPTQPALQLIARPTSQRPPTLEPVLNSVVPTPIAFPDPVALEAVRQRRTAAARQDDLQRALATLKDHERKTRLVTALRAADLSGFDRGHVHGWWRAARVWIPLGFLLGMLAGSALVALAIRAGMRS